MGSLLKVLVHGRRRLMLFWRWGSLQTSRNCIHFWVWLCIIITYGPNNHTCWHLLQIWSRKRVSIGRTSVRRYSMPCGSLLQGICWWFIQIFDIEMDTSNYQLGLSWSLWLFIQENWVALREITPQLRRNYWYCGDVQRFLYDASGFQNYCLH